MVKRWSIWVLLLNCAIASGGQGDALKWDSLPPLPPAARMKVQPGLAGAFGGVHNDALILAGGANFPDGLPWVKLPDGSSPKKIYHTDIYVLLKTGDKYAWVTSDVKLPRGYSYGVSITTDDGLLCIGGEWREYGAGGVKKFKSDKVFLIRHLGKGKVEIQDDLPALPEACSAMAGAKVGNTIYIAGGSNGQTETKNFWSLDLSGSVWKKLDPWGGAPRSHLVAAAASNGRKNCFYIFSGRYNDPAKGWVFLKDSWMYDGAKWTRVADVGTNLQDKTGICVMAASGIKTGANHIAIFGGADGKLFLEVEQELPRQIKTLSDAGKNEEADALVKKKNDLYTNHPGFSRDILAYHTVTNTWRSIGKLPESQVAGLTAGSHVTTTAVKWDKDIIIPSGEVRPAVRSPNIWIASPGESYSFGMLNYVVLIAYLLALVAMGYYFSRRENTTDDFFKAGGRIPWWAAGLSIFGTQLSAITFMAIPASSFGSDWRMFILNMTIIMVAPLVVFIFLPFYRRLNVTTAYEFIEKRFNLSTRLLASGLFMVFQLARIGIVLYLPSIALSVVTGVDIKICITVMAVLSIAYTVMGGIEAVIWTDVIQVFVLLGGALLVLCMIPLSFTGGWNSMVDVAESGDKLRLLDFHFSWKSPTFWILVFGGVGANIYSYACDQAVIQRYLTTKSEKEAARGIWTSALLAIPASLIFFGIGSVLYSFYATQPEALSPVVQKADAIFPWYIVTQLPAGVSGLLIAGVFAAAMSSLDSSMNSVATAFTTDFYRRLQPAVSDRKCLNVARIVTVIIGVGGMGLALAMDTWDIDSLWQQFNRFIGLFGAGLAGLFLLAVFTRRTSGYGALIGLLCSVGVQYYLRELNCIHGILFNVTGLVSCFVVGYVASLVIRNRKNIDGMTIYTLQKRED
ncbi:MAG: sodium/solute symporter [Phycisphaerae bacterium]|jgi:SSS family transporter|nr:sodium/solute symporter [Phycisphaerae bacterium]